MWQEDPYAVTATDPPVSQYICKTIRLTLDISESVGSEGAVSSLIDESDPGALGSPTITNIGSDVISRRDPPTKTTPQVLVPWSV